MKHEFLKRLISSIILVFLIIFLLKKIILFNFFILICLLISSSEWFLMSKNKRYHIPGHIFLLISFFCIYSLRNNYSNNDSLNYIIFILTICVLTDLGGYIFGKVLKGPKLTKISPNKTIFGMLGSFILPLLFTIPILENNNLEYLFEFNLIIDFNYHLLILFFSFISQIGDLIISYFKRVSKIDDTGRIIPGHGGLLDRIDGIIFVFPIMYLFIEFFKL